MVRLLAILCALFVCAIAFVGIGTSTASAQTPVNYFYCYGVDASQGTVFMSDVQQVGPLSERASYGEQFKAYLRAKGTASSSVQTYCVMRATAREIALGQTNLPVECRTCGDITRFENVLWSRDGKAKGAEALLSGGLIKPDAFQQGELGKAEEPPAPPKEEDEQDGVYILGSRDETDLVYAVNEDNGETKAKLKADLKGGKWTTIASNNRCPGWMAVAFASDGTTRYYYLAQGASSEGEASMKALEMAEEGAKRQDGNWTTGVLIAFQNKYERKSIGAGDLVESVSEDGVVGTMRGLAWRALTSDCPKAQGPGRLIKSSGNPGVRG